MAEVLRKPRFRFTLGTLLLLIAIAGIGLGIITEQDRAISERHDVLGMVGQHVHTVNFGALGDPKRHLNHANFYRRWAGDFPLVETIWLPEGALSAVELERVRRAYPEAVVETYEQDLPSSARFKGRVMFDFSESLKAARADASDGK